MIVEKEVSIENASDDGFSDRIFRHVWDHKRDLSILVVQSVEQNARRIEYGNRLIVAGKGRDRNVSDDRDKCDQCHRSQERRNDEPLGLDAFQELVFGYDEDVVGHADFGDMMVLYFDGFSPLLLRDGRNKNLSHRRFDQFEPRNLVSMPQSLIQHDSGLCIV